MGSSFDGVGGLLAAPIMAALNSDMERAAVKLAEPEDGARYLVLGFGGGVGITALLDVVEPEWVLAVDPSEAMHRAAAKRLSRHLRGGCVELRNATAAQIPPGVDADAAIAVNSHQLWQPHEESVVAISRGLRPGGRLITLTHQWAITNTMPLEAWKVRVHSDLVEAGFNPPSWTEASYRSGRGLALLASKGGDGHTPEPDAS